MGWFDVLREIDPFDDLPFDRSLVDALEIAAQQRPLGVLRFFTPTFRSFVRSGTATMLRVSTPLASSTPA